MSRSLFVAFLAAAATLRPTPAHAISISTDIEKLPIWGITLNVHTCNATNAQSAGDLGVRLTTVSGKIVYLDNPGTDRQKDGFDTWSISPSDVKTVADIQRIQFETKSNDGWCFDQVALTVNGGGYPLFLEHMGPVWLDTDGSSVFKIFSSELRGNTFWNVGYGGNSCYLPHSISTDDLALKAEGLVATQIHGRSVSWDGGVSFSRRSSTSDNVVTKLKAPTSFLGISGTANITATTHLAVGCGVQSVNGVNKNVLQFTSSAPSVNVDAPWYIDLATFGLDTAVFDYIFQNALDSIGEAITLDTPIYPASITVDSSGDLYFDWGSVTGINLNSQPGLTCPSATAVAALCKANRSLPFCM